MCVINFYDRHIGDFIYYTLNYENMKMAYILTLMLSTVMVSGLLLGSMGSDVFASGQEKGNDGGEGKVDHGKNGCETATEASQGKTKNPHCVDEEPPCNDPIVWWPDTDGDGLGDATKSPMVACTQPVGFVSNSDDPDDGDCLNPDATGSSCP